MRNIHRAQGVCWWSPPSSFVRVPETRPGNRSLQCDSGGVLVGEPNPINRAVGAAIKESANDLTTPWLNIGPLLSIFTRFFADVSELFRSFDKSPLAKLDVLPRLLTDH